MSASAWTVAPLQGDPSASHNSSPHDGHSRPHVQRPLSSSELKRLDVYMFGSPKEARVVAVHGPLQLAVRLQLEFDPQIVAVVERPRRLEVGLRSQELHFWWRHKNGREHYALVFSDEDTIPGTDGRRRPREVDRLRQASQTAGMQLHLLTKDEILRPAMRTELCFHLLGFTQSLGSLDSAVGICHSVAQVMQSGTKLAVRELNAELSHIPVSQLRIVVAHLLHIGYLQTDALHRMNDRSIIWRTR